MNLPTLAVLSAVALAAVAAVVFIRRRGASPCSACSRADCPARNLKRGYKCNK